MLVGYARVSTAEQNPDHQTDALLRAGVTPGDIYVDHASGAKASRPKLDLVLRILQGGDVLVVTRLDRLGRSVLHLVTLGAQLRERGVGLKVVEQGIDTATAEGRAMFGMLSVLAELQRELIVANNRDGLAAARARGHRGGRPSKLTPDQAALAQRLYDAGEHTVAQIADMLGIPRSTIYGHLNKATVGTRPHAQKTAAAMSPAVHPSPDIGPAGDGHTHEPALTPRTSRACPSCGHEPITREEATTQRADLAVTWLSTDPHRPGQLLPRQHCRHCQPHHPVVDIACEVCGDGPILTGDLASETVDAGTPPKPVQQWLAADGWQLTPEPLCPDHRTESASCLPSACASGSSSEKHHRALPASAAAPSHSPYADRSA